MTNRHNAITETMFDSEAAGAAGSEAPGLRQLSVCESRHFNCASCVTAVMQHLNSSRCVFHYRPTVHQRFTELDFNSAPVSFVTTLNVPLPWFNNSLKSESFFERAVIQYSSTQTWQRPVYSRLAQQHSQCFQLYHTDDCTESPGLYKSYCFRCNKRFCSTVAHLTGLLVSLLQESRLTVGGQIIIYCSAGHCHV